MSLHVSQILFYLFGAIAIVTSLLVIGQRNAMYSVILLVASFAALSGLYVLLDAPFIAVIQIIIYAGAIMLLFLFVVMLLNVGREEAAPAAARGSLFGAALAAVLAGELIWALQRLGDDELVVSAGQGGSVSGVRDIGLALFTEYGVAFEATSILILVAMVGAVVLARREPQ